MIDRPFSKSTAMIIIVFSVLALILIPVYYPGYEIKTEILVIIAASVSSAATFLFMADKKKDGND